MAESKSTGSTTPAPQNQLSLEDLLKMLEGEETDEDVRLLRNGDKPLNETHAMGGRQNTAGNRALATMHPNNKLIQALLQVMTARN